MTRQIRLRLFTIALLLSLAAGADAAPQATTEIEHDPPVSNSTETNSVVTTNSDDQSHQQSPSETANSRRVEETVDDSNSLSFDMIYSWEPRVFDTVTFKAPEGSSGNYIKRLEGLNDVTRSPRGSDSSQNAKGHTDESGRIVHLSDDQSPITLEMYQQEVLILDLGGWDPVVSVNGPLLIELESLSDGQYDDRIKVIPRATGFCSMKLARPDGLTRTLNVRIVDDFRELQHLLNTLYPDASVQVHPIKSSVLLRGNVDSSKQIDEIIQIAEQFSPQVLNQLRAGSQNSISSEPGRDGASAGFPVPPGKRVITVDLATPRTHTKRIEPGDVIDIYASEKANTGVNSADGVIAISPAGIVLEDVVVFAVDSSSDAGGSPDESESQSLQVSLLVSPEESELVLRYRGNVQLVTDSAEVSTVNPLTGIHSSLPAAQPDRGMDEVTILRSAAADDLIKEIRELRKDVRQLTALLRARATQNESNSADSAVAAGEIPGQTSTSFDANLQIVDYVFPLQLPMNATGGDALVFVLSDSCGVCRSMLPVIDSVKTRGVPLMILDFALPEAKTVVDSLNLTAVPTLLRVQNGRVVNLHQGAASEEEIFSFFLDVAR